MTLGTLGTDKAVEALIGTLQGTAFDPKLRNAAAFGLCQSTNRKVIGPLIDAPTIGLCGQVPVDTSGPEETHAAELRQVREWREWKARQAGQDPR